MRNILKSGEVFHFWANRVQPSGRCGNTRFDGDTLYSYAAPIAKHLPDGSIAVATKNWSMTTSGHQSAARNAVPHGVRVIRVYQIDVATGVIEHARKEADTLIEKASKARTKRGEYLAEALQVATYANEYAEATNVSERINLTELSGRNLSDIKADLAKRQAQEKADVAKLKREATERLAATLQGWRDHNPDAHAWMLRGAAVALRISADKETVETSQNANIPVDDAIALWPLILRCKAGERAYTPGQPIGHYRLTQIRRDGSLLVGCHDIAFTEIERIAKQLGLLQPQPELEAA